LIEKISNNDYSEKKVEKFDNLEGLKDSMPVPPKTSSIAHRV
jgi:hypothetical protein